LSNSKDGNNREIDQQVVDFDSLEVNSHLIQANDIFCCLGSTIKKAGSQEAFKKVDFTYPYELAKLASANGGERYLIITAIGSNERAPAFYSRVKGQVEKAVSREAFKGVHIFRPSFIVGKRAEKRPAEDFLIGMGRATAFTMVGPFKRFRPIKAEAIAGAMVAVAEQELSGVTIYESHQIQQIYDESLAT